MPFIVVFAANAALMILQLVAGPLLVPFVGNSLETWTCIVGAFLAALAGGTAVGGRSTRSLAFFLLLAALGATWLVLLPRLLALTELHRMLPFAVRVPVLAILACGPAAFALGLPLPRAAKLARGDAGQAAGRAFATAAGGSLVGNYLTGFVLVPTLPLDAIGGAVVAGLLLLAAVVRSPVPPQEPHTAHGRAGRYALIAALASFAAMAMELTAARLLAQVVGSSLYTWAGVIGVTLAGTACGNLLGGRSLPAHLVAASLALVVAPLAFIGLAFASAFDDLALPWRVLAWSFALFFVPAVLLGTISPQCVKLAGGADVGRTAARIYACSTLGAVAGTFATGYVLIAVVGSYRTLMLAGALVGAAAVLAGGVAAHKGRLYALSVAFGLAVAGCAMLTPEATKIDRETSYFAIRIVDAPDGIVKLQLDRLVHSFVKPADPLYLHYKHERIQWDVLCAKPGPTLVVGGGGYTFPRAAATRFPRIRMDVVEIDPDVTAISYAKLGLDPALGIRSFARDGRQFLDEDAAPGTYQLITLDAVNDLSVPSHLLTRECNAAVKRALLPGGVYLVSVIDLPRPGGLLAAVGRTLQRDFAHVELLATSPTWEPDVPQVYVLYASDTPLDWAQLAPAATFRTPGLPSEGLLLTDQFAPTDQLLMPAYRRRKE